MYPSVSAPVTATAVHEWYADGDSVERYFACGEHATPSRRVAAQAIGHQRTDGLISESAVLIRHTNAFGREETLVIEGLQEARALLDVLRRALADAALACS